jgi:hypothetical protein
MKSSQVLASVLFGSFAAAVPFKRDLATKTELVVETVVVYTTVWDDTAVAEATTSAGGNFYEQPASSVVAEITTSSTPTPAYTPSNTPSAVEEPSSVYTPPAQTPSPSSVVVTSSAAPVETSAPAPVVPTTTEAAPAPVSSAAAPVYSAPASGGTSTGETYSGDVTIYDNTGGFGACGKALYDTDMVVALSKDAWGASTYDVMTGEATNPWCGQKIKIQANGKEVVATIMDMCPGCKGDDIDLSVAAWSAIGMVEKTRITGTWSKTS